MTLCTDQDPPLFCRKPTRRALPTFLKAENIVCEIIDFVPPLFPDDCSTIRYVPFLVYSGIWAPNVHHSFFPVHHFVYITSKTRKTRDMCNSTAHLINPLLLRLLLVMLKTAKLLQPIVTLPYTHHSLVFLYTSMHENKTEDCLWLYSTHLSSEVHCKLYDLTSCHPEHPPTYHSGFAYNHGL